MSQPEHRATKPPAHGGGHLSDPTTDLVTAPTGSQSHAPDAPSQRHGSPTRIIALMNQKGGVGKTTTTVNLGTALARNGHNVLLIDLDPQAHLSLSVGIEPDDLDKSIYHLLTETDTLAAHVVQQVNKNLGVLPAEVSLAGIETELADHLATGHAQTILRNKAGQLAEQFDFVLIDCPPSLGLLTINALTLAREVIVPMQAHFLALQGLSKLLETISMVRQGINNQLLVAGIVLCMHESQTILAGEITRDVESFLQQAHDTDLPWNRARLFKPPIRRNIKLAESPSFGQAIFDYAPDSHGAADYAALANTIASHRVHGASTPGPTP